jgi:hypothetical protein
MMPSYTSQRVDNPFVREQRWMDGTKKMSAYRWLSLRTMPLSNSRTKLAGMLSYRKLDHLGHAGSGRSPQSRVQTPKKNPIQVF